jgi:hypothetical protein
MPTITALLESARSDIRGLLTSYPVKSGLDNGDDLCYTVGDARDNAQAL